jgi:hypothetical protein
MQMVCVGPYVHGLTELQVTPTVYWHVVVMQPWVEMPPAASLSAGSVSNLMVSARSVSFVALIFFIGAQL